MKQFILVLVLSHVWLFATPWTCQTPLSKGFSKQEYWSGLSFPTPGDLPGVCFQETQEIRVRSLGWEDPLEEDMATHSSTLAWRIPCTEEPGGLQSVESQRVRHDWSDWARTHAWLPGPLHSPYLHVFINQEALWSSGYLGMIDYNWPLVIDLTLSPLPLSKGRNWGWKFQPLNTRLVPLATSPYP